MYTCSYKMKKYLDALDYAKQFTKVTMATCRAESIQYVEALYQEASIMNKIPSCHPEEQLDKTNEALKALYKVDNYQMSDPFLVTLYLQKAKILRTLGGDSADTNKHNIHVLQCVNSAEAVIKKTGVMSEFDIQELRRGLHTKHAKELR